MARIVKNTEKECDSRVIHPLNRFPLSTTEDPINIFNFPFLADRETISYIKDHGRVMFIIRGPPYTKKTKLSNMLLETYPGSPYCSMVKVIECFDPKDDSTHLGSEIVQKTFDRCKKLLTEACASQEPTIIVQNSHMRKLEMIAWLELAVAFDYIVIMAATMYKFDVTPEALVREGGLDISYLRKRFDLWEDVAPLFTAWFLSPNDSEYIRYITFEKLKALVEIQKFRSWIGTDDVTSYFFPRANLSCLAGYSADAERMKKYYFSKEVQTAYSKCFSIFIIGFLITKFDIIGVVQLDRNMKSLVMEESTQSSENNVEEVNFNILQYEKTTEFPQKEHLPSKSSGHRKKWIKGEKIPINTCRPIHLAQNGFNVFSMDKLCEQFNEGLQLMSDHSGILKEKYADFGKGTSSLYKLKNDLWFANVSEKFCFSSIFTGFYA